jgi:hypothetical protein
MKSPLNIARKTSGDRYERYIASMLRGEGWEVIEKGKYGYYDHGIDLIATKDGMTRYIQCKGWQFWKELPETVVTQLFGSVAAIEGIDNIRNVEIYIYASATLGSYAADDARKLNVQFVLKRFNYWKHGRKELVADSK